MKAKLGLILSLCVGVVASICCLPALFFLLFGFSFGIAGVEFLAPYRLIFSVLSCLCFTLYLYFGILKCDCAKTCKRKKGISGFLWLLVLLCILFYPEILGWVYE
ncbi:MAG: aryl sulfotransferase [Helicobacter sp.]|uniref:aryl sulfotransferase n=1 Tax=Helicobacter sp. TaxID=218 RepID=UPI0023D1ACA4|nr:aryl sulfotransferase [Helicobacter sp.]MDE5925816.1 aryl sulfotransferase [Helicobacter sp.]MDE7175095.1 aryl sulfotransferase [Helicobacter sp.]